MTVEAFVYFVRIAPTAHQRDRAGGRQSKVARHSPFALEAPVDCWRSPKIQRHHAPHLGRRKHPLRLGRRHINHRARTHLESIAFVHRDAEGFVAPAIVTDEQLAQLVQRRIEQAYRPAAAANHPRRPAYHARA